MPLILLIHPLTMNISPIESRIVYLHANPKKIHLVWFGTFSLVNSLMPSKQRRSIFLKSRNMSLIDKSLSYVRLSIYSYNFYVNAKTLTKVS